MRAEAPRACLGNDIWKPIALNVDAPEMVLRAFFSSRVASLSNLHNRSRGHYSYITPTASVLISSNVSSLSSYFVLSVLFPPVFFSFPLLLIRAVFALCLGPDLCARESRHGHDRVGSHVITRQVGKGGHEIGGPVACS